MGLEIERKFLVKNEGFVKAAFKKDEIKQGFLNSDKGRVVRVRIRNNKGFITVKGISDTTGMIRKEWEYEIPLSEAEELLQICEPNIIEKTRYYVKHNSLIVEVDVFKHLNQGLILAEIELRSKDQTFETPYWIDEEITGNEKYYNSYLSKYPFSSWK